MANQPPCEQCAIHIKLIRTNAEKDLRKQQRRTDKMREAVAAYLNGEISKKKLEKVYHNTDYSFSIGE